MKAKSLALLLGAACLLPVLLYLVFARYDGPQAPALSLNDSYHPVIASAPLITRSAPLVSATVSALPQNMTQTSANPLERSEDLRAIYQQFKDSANASERHIAWRAWSACFPTFIGAQGQSATIENLTAALPAHDTKRSARIDAYRALQGRCKAYSDMRREEMLATTRQLQQAYDSGTNLSPGEAAAKLLAEGKTAEAVQMARAIVLSQDPFAIHSLRDFIQPYVVQQVDAQMAASRERPDLRGLAFSLAACQMGLECGPGSLSALQLCASIGACSGSVSERYLQALPDQADRDALQQESRRVLDALRSADFAALGLLAP